VSTPFLAEVRIFAFGYAPRGWAQSNGQLLPINQNQALFSLLGTTYGGNGTTNFALPDLRGRTPAHIGNTVALGQQGGQEGVTLNINQIPQHGHAMLANAANANSGSPNGAAFAPTTDGTLLYQSGGNLTPIQPAGGYGSVGSSQPHTNMQPYLVVNFCIALQGIFPSRN
jgi:microcystin-dependent protein